MEDLNNSTDFDFAWTPIYLGKIPGNVHQSYTVFSWLSDLVDVFLSISDFLNGKLIIATLENYHRKKMLRDYHVIDDD